MELILLRHAKSSWDVPGQKDAERPLNERGRREALRLGAWLAERDLWPDQVLCSTARRTMDTWARVAEGGARTAPVDALSELYAADEATIWDAIAPWARAGSRIAVVGHNPGLSALASRLGGREVDLKTACLARFTCLRPSDELWRRRPSGESWRLEETGCPGR